MRNWYYAVDGARKGPVTEDEIIALINSGEINSETLVWTEEFTEWKKLSDVKDVFPVPVTPKSTGKKFSSALAIASMIFGILSIICFGPLLAIPGLVLGVIALVKIKKGSAQGKGFALAGIITSLISIIMAIIFIILFFMASFFSTLNIKEKGVNYYRKNNVSDSEKNRNLQNTEMYRKI